MQPAIKLRNIELGSGRPKLAVPITGTTINDILAATTPILAAQPDVVEWRIDFFKDVTNPEQLKSAGQQLRQALGDIALLTTFRTKGEGGELALSDTEYFKLCETVLDGGFTDALDVERYHDEQAVKQIVAAAHEHQVVVIMSNHDFDKTPAVAEMAVMPQSVEDVLTLLTATNIARQTLPQPVITMSMGDLGKVSRLAGEVFGSCLSFATVGAASAPGQIALENLRPELEDLKLN
ncbi:3-dehydroquinate dehydratase [Lactiplantibacillus plantarum]|nr:type I 3-dehydroquinate dehydratase [Lactiplantibacillus plantarum]VDH10478.1 3-dehydroquinate dehydratase [Lactiplantibacillus plantarum]